MKTSDIYFQRSPVLGVGWIHRMYSNVEIDEVVATCKNDKSIMERILVASESLYEALQKDEMSEQAKMACIKYILRMSARPMPFGLLAGVTKMSFTSISIEKEKKIVELSMDWLEELTQLIEQAQEIESKLLVIKNSVLRETVDSYYIDVAVDDKDKRLYFKKSSFFVELLSFVEQPRTIQTIIHHFTEKSPGNEQVILTTIKKLLHNKCLISNLRPSSIKRETNLEYLLEKKDLYSENTYDELKNLDALINMYKEHEIGDGIDIFQEIIKSMKRMCSSKSYLVVDLVVEQQDKKEIQKETIETFIKHIDFLKGVNYLSLYHLLWDKYHVEFSDRYGLYNEVSVLDVVDSDVGIGMPSLKEYESVFMNEVQREYDNFLLRFIQKVSLHNETVVKLKEKDIEYIKKLTRYEQREKNKQGFDVKASFIYEGEEQKIVLTDNAFGVTPFSFTGRLHYPTKRNDEQCINENDNTILAEINVIPNQYKNLGVTYIVPPAQINIQAFPEDNGLNIPIDDLVVGMEEEGFYLKSKTLQKRVLPISTHKLFYSNFNEDKPLLFLSQLGNYLSQTPADFSLGVMKDASFIPRIEYQNVILSLKRWNLMRREMEEYVSANLTEEAYVKQFLLDYKVDRLVNMLIGDMILPIKIDTKLGIRLIIEELKKEGVQKLTLVEAPELQDENKLFNVDYIFTIIPTTPADDRQTIQHGLYDEPTLYDLDWIYYNVYYRKGRRVSTAQLLADLLREYDIRHFFFVNYKDTEEHIRVRIKATEFSSKAQVDQALKMLIQDGRIKKYSEHNYLPEYSRYGGRHLMEEVHNLFVLDTTLSLAFSYTREYATLNEVEKGILVCIHTVMDLFDTYKQAMDFLSKLTPVKNKSLFQTFTRARKKYVDVGKQSLHLYVTDFSIMKEKRKKCRKFVKELEPFTEERKFYMLQSLLHMTMNRILGIDGEMEREVYELAKYTFHNLKYPLDILEEYDDYL